MYKALLLRSFQSHQWAKGIKITRAMFGTQLSDTTGAEAKGVVPSLPGQLAICMSTHPSLLITSAYSKLSAISSIRRHHLSLFVSREGSESMGKNVMQGKSWGTWELNLSWTSPSSPSASLATHRSGQSWSKLKKQWDLSHFAPDIKRPRHCTAGTRMTA